jgi:hypothetical protein
MIRSQRGRLLRLANLAAVVPVSLLAGVSIFRAPQQRTVELWILAVVVPGLALAISIGISLCNLYCRFATEGTAGAEIAVALAVVEAQLRSGQIVADATEVRDALDEVQLHLGRGEIAKAARKMEDLRRRLGALHTANQISVGEYTTTLDALSQLAAAAGLPRHRRG